LGVAEREKRKKQRNQHESQAQKKPEPGGTRPTQNRNCKTQVSKSETWGNPREKSDGSTQDPGSKKLNLGHRRDLGVAEREKRKKQRNQHESQVQKNPNLGATRPTQNRNCKTRVSKSETWGTHNAQLDPRYFS